MVKLILFLLVNLIVFLIYLKLPKSLHPLETLACYLVGFIYTHDWLIIASVNLKYWEISMNTQNLIIISLVRIELLPIIMLLFVEQFVSTNHSLKKGIIFILFVLFMFIFEQIHHLLGIISHKGWENLWTILLSVGLGALLIITRVYAHYLISKVGDER